MRLGRFRTGPESGYGWLSAVIPADARRFRVADAALADVLREAGADVTDVCPDVEIGPAGQLVGDAPVSITVLGRPRHSSTEKAFPIRALRALVRSTSVRFSARRTLRAVRRLGHPKVVVLMWDHHQTLHDPTTSRRKREPLRQYFQQRALVIGGHVPGSRALLEEVVNDANTALGARLDGAAPWIRTGLLIVDTAQGVLRVAVGPGSHQIRNQRSALTSLRASSPPAVVAERVPWILASGRSGLADWSLEQRLGGNPPKHPVSGKLLSDCLDFLVALHPLGSADENSVLRQQAEIVTHAARREEAHHIQALAAYLEAALAEVPRGFAHGDFFHNNLLAVGGRLVGVLDWDAAGPGRLPLLDLLHLRHVTQALPDSEWGPRLIQQLVPWARAGGDQVARGYCERLGLPLDRDQLEALVFAYWLDRVASQLSSHSHRQAQRLWLDRNITFVLRATTELVRSPV